MESQACPRTLSCCGTTSTRSGTPAPCRITLPGLSSARTGTATTHCTIPPAFQHGANNRDLRCVLQPAPPESRWRHHRDLRCVLQPAPSGGACITDRILSNYQQLGLGKFKNDKIGMRQCLLENPEAQNFINDLSVYQNTSRAQDKPLKSLIKYQNTSRAQDKPKHLRVEGAKQASNPRLKPVTPMCW